MRLQWGGIACDQSRDCLFQIPRKEVKVKDRLRKARGHSQIDSWVYVFISYALEEHWELLSARAAWWYLILEEVFGPPDLMGKMQVGQQSSKWDISILEVPWTPFKGMVLRKLISKFSTFIFIFLKIDLWLRCHAGFRHDPSPTFKTKQVSSYQSRISFWCTALGQKNILHVKQGDNLKYSC